MCSVAASMPCATTWSTFAVIVAESDLPSKMITSAPYFSLAYFCASVAWPWWNTFDRSETKNAIFFGAAVAGLNSPAAAGALVGSAGATVGAGAWVGAGAGVGVGFAPQADTIRLVSTSKANRTDRFFFISSFLLFAWGLGSCSLQSSPLLGNHTSLRP